MGITVGMTRSLLLTSCSAAPQTSCYKRANFVMMCASLVRALEPPIVIALVLPQVTRTGPAHRPRFRGNASGLRFGA